MVLDPPSVVLDPPSVVLDPPSVVLDPPSVVLDPPSVVLDPPSPAFAPASSGLRLGVLVPPMANEAITGVANTEPASRRTRNCRRLEPACDATYSMMSSDIVCLPYFVGRLPDLCAAHGFARTTWVV
ncbi:unannotated protein [freshwater metagenome]|uniref:Unannotated protein n=1 Tax=freshwater metagenome TaxID=449393 RepID=A0A6J6A507_9ZZZZ